MSPDNTHYVRYIEALKGSSLFNELESNELHSILKLMTKEKWDSNVFKKSSNYVDNLFFIVSGRLKVYQINSKTGREHTIFILSKGDIFDIFNLLDTEINTVFWEPLDDLELLNINNESMRQFIQYYATLNMSIFRYLGKRMRMLEDSAIDSCMHNTLTRLSNLLLKNINKQSNKLELINNLPNDEIASLIGTTRAVVNRHIQELKKAGAISVKRNQIDIENVQLLISIAEEKFSVKV